MLLVFNKGVTGNSKTITQFKDDIINGLIQQSNSVPEVPELYDEHVDEQIVGKQ